MRIVMALLALPLISGCDRVSQRVWNCSSYPLEVLKGTDTGNEVVEILPARSYIASMKGGAQIVSLKVAAGGGTKTVCERGRSLRKGNAANADEACGGKMTGVIAEQF